jgi:hypothetical protein
MVTDTWMHPLNRTEFTAALKKGQGRAFQHIAQYGIGDFEDLVLDACLHNQNYDSQVDPARAPWLFSIIKAAPNYDMYRDAIFSDLETSDSWDLIQECHLLYEMIQTGDQDARSKLKTIVFQQASQAAEWEHIFVDFIVEFITRAEFLELARIYGNRLIDDPEDSPPASLFPDARKREFAEILDQSGRDDPPILRYRQYLTNLEQGEPPERIRTEYSLEQILDNAHKKRGKYPGQYLSFGKQATPDELKKVFTLLLDENDPEVRLRLLWVFRRAHLPALNEVLFEWANGSDAALRQAVIYTLGDVTDERVHSLALEKLKKGELMGPDAGVIKLFHHNYDHSDAGLIASALTKVSGSDEDHHSLGYDLRELSETQSDLELSDALYWVYEMTPCMTCRYNVLLELQKYNRISDQITSEIPYDCDPYIRDLVTGLGFNKPNNISGQV